MKKIFDKFEEVIGVALLAYMLVILTCQVILRFVFNSSNSWSEETARYLFVWFVYITASLAILKNAHIRIDAFLGMYPTGIVRGVVVLGYLLFFVYCMAIVHFSWAFTMQIRNAGQISMGLGTPMYLVYMALPVCHALMALRIIQRLRHICFKGEPVRIINAEIER